MSRPEILDVPIYTPKDGDLRHDNDGRVWMYVYERKEWCKICGTDGVQKTISDVGFRLPDIPPFEQIPPEVAFGKN